MFEGFIETIIFVMFPILIYFFYVVYKNMIDKKENNLFLVLALVSSFYLSLRLGDNYFNPKFLIFTNIPIVISYVKKKHICAIFLSLIFIIYCSFVLNFYVVLIVIIKFVLYFVAYLYCNKNKKYKFIDVVAIIQGFILSFEFIFLQVTVNDFLQVLLVLVMVFIFYIVTFIIVYLFDVADKISNLYLSYKELEQDKQIRNSLFKITHEVKNPIAVCKGYLDMFDCKDVKRSSKYIEIMKQEVDRTLNIMNDFLELNKISVEKEILDINMLIYEIANNVKLIFPNKNIKLFNNILEDDEVYIMGDYNRLKQVFLNLLKNAFESILDTGIVEINAFIKDNKYVILIKDNGIGMDKETLNNIKCAFFTTKPKGNGVGVTLSNEIIKAHGGMLKYQSKLGVGTTTKVILPILKED